MTSESIPGFCRFGTSRWVMFGLGVVCESGGSWVPPARRPQPETRPFRSLGPSEAPRRLPRQFPHLLHSSWNGRQAYLRLSDTYGCNWQDLKAVCGRHPNCGRSRSCRVNRPIGELWAWLEQMHDPGCLSKAHHCAFIPSFEQRTAARAMFKSLPSEDVRSFLAAEADGGGVDEPP